MKEKPLDTALVGGMTVKTDLRIAFFGETDTLSSYIMELTYYLDQNDKKLNEELKTIVRKLSEIMGIVAGVKKEFSDENVNHLLQVISDYKTSAPVLKEFVLPGSNLVSAKIHIVRTMSRRCELAYARVYEKYSGSKTIFEYLNKLSTLFYELALYYEK